MAFDKVVMASWEKFSSWYNVVMKMPNINWKQFGKSLLRYVFIIIGVAFMFVALSLVIDRFVQRPQLAGAVVAAGTLTLAIAAFWAIWNSNQREKHRRELESKRRSLDEIKQWIHDVIRLQARWVKPLESAGDVFQQQAETKIIVSNAEYITTEVQRFDSEFPEEVRKLIGNIGRISFIVEHQDGPSLKELEDKCIEALKVISDIKAALQL